MHPHRTDPIKGPSNNAAPDTTRGRGSETSDITRLKFIPRYGTAEKYLYLLLHKRFACKLMTDRGLAWCFAAASPRTLSEATTSQNFLFSQPHSLESKRDELGSVGSRGLRHILKGHPLVTVSAVTGVPTHAVEHLHDQIRICLLINARMLQSFSSSQTSDCRETQLQRINQKPRLVFTNPLVSFLTYDSCGEIFVWGSALVDF